ncbi:MAG: DnaD domain protein [Turicibacter sp.]|nr:DnaD domain protein [Turicibacter sp.]
MNYFSFDGDIAREYGVEEAILYQFFLFWIKKNIANNKHQYDGHTWTYNSQQALTDLFPFWNRKKIQRLLKSMEDKGLLIKGNYNQLSYDRTTWYALPKYEQSIGQKRTMGGPKMDNGLSESDQPIPVNYHLTTVNNDDNNIHAKENEIYHFYQQNFGVLTPIVGEKLVDWIKDLSVDLVKEALIKTLMNNSRSFSYAEAIMRDWYHNNIKTLEQVRSLDLEHQTKRTKETRGSRNAKPIKTHGEYDSSGRQLL